MPSRLKAEKLSKHTNADELRKASQIGKLIDSFQNTAVEETNVNVNGAANATEEMAASISEISTQAANSNRLAQDAKNKINETVEVINTLAASAVHIE